MFIRFIIGLFLYFPINQIYAQTYTFMPAHESIRHFERVEWIYRDEGANLQYAFNLQVVKWVDTFVDNPIYQSVHLSDSLVGLTEQGQLVQVVTVGGRNFVYFLGGNKKYLDFFVTKKGHLFALDFNKMLLPYSPNTWDLSSNSDILKTHFKNATSLTLLGLAFVAFFDPTLDFTNLSDTVSFSKTVLPSIGVIFTSFWTQLGLAQMKIEKDNFFPNGLIDSHAIDLSSIENIERIPSFDKLGVDYRLTDEKNKTFLLSKILKKLNNRKLKNPGFYLGVRCRDVYRPQLPGAAVIRINAPSLY